MCSWSSIVSLFVPQKSDWQKVFSSKKNKTTKQSTLKAILLFNAKRKKSVFGGFEQSRKEIQKKNVIYTEKAMKFTLEKSILFPQSITQ